MTMELNILENYDLPDSELLRSGNSSGSYMVWVPERLMVVIGKGSNPELELITNLISEDDVPVIRRDTGGCAVVLSPEMVVVSFLMKNDKDRKQGEYFRLFDKMILSALRKLGVESLEMAGSSDITLNGLKVAGSSIYRNKDIVFFHAIINLNGGVGAMERYLKIPPREPDYRNGRSHKDFVTSFKAQGYVIDPQKLDAELKTEWLFHFGS
jgi:lipoate-protein ligase A